MRAVLIDFYDTIGRLEGGRILALREQLAGRVGAPEARFFDVWRASFLDRSKGLLGPLEQEYAAVLAEVGVTAAPALLAQIADEERAAWRTSVRFYPEVPSVLATVREHGLKLALVSNCSDPAADAIRWMNTAALFDTLVLSCEVGLIKPDAAIYQLACERLAVEPSECAFVGDGGSRELEGAHRLGMLTIRMEQPNHGDDRAGDQPFHHHLVGLSGLPTALGL